MLKSTSAVSVVIPTRNRAHLVSGAIASAFAQTHVDVEVVVVNDGSVDDTEATLDALDDARLVVVHRKGDNGEPQARNAGVEAASHDVLAFLDDDDRWAPSKLRRQLEAMQDSDADWAICGARLVTPDGDSLGVQSTNRIERAARRNQILRLFLTTNQVPGPGSSLMVTRSAFEAVGRFNPTVPLFADWDLYIRLAALGEPALVDEPLVDYTQHDGQMTNDLRNGWSALAGFRERYRDHRAAEDVRVADESVLLWVAWQQARAEGPRLVFGNLRDAGVVRQPSDVPRLVRTIGRAVRGRTHG